MVTIKTKEEIKLLEQGGRILADVLEEVSGLAKAGVSTGFLNAKAKEIILARGAESAFEGYRPNFSNRPYPAAICASLNNIVVHGLPGDNVILRDGDILKLDVGVKYKNLFTDAALTIGIGEMTDEKIKLINATKRALELAIGEVKPGNHLGDIGFAIENCFEKEKLSVIKELVGHGVGYAVHEEPNICNFGKRGEGMALKPGMVLAIEPMAALGGGEVRESKNGLSYETIDGSLTAHFEHTVAVTDNGCLILTK